MKLCLVVDQGLTTGQKAAQLVHGMRAWSEHQPELDREWFAKSNTVVCLETPDVDRLKSNLEDLNHPHAWFCEPDYDDKLTCVVFLSDKKVKKICRSLPLVG